MMKGKSLIVNFPTELAIAQYANACMLLSKYSGILSIIR